MGNKHLAVRSFFRPRPSADRASEAPPDSCNRLGLVVLLHGFTQTGQSWEPLVDAMASGRRFLAPDAPGHGSSSDVTADMWGTAALLAEHVPEPATWVGYSMGGRTALHVALAHPASVGRLVLVSATAGLEDEQQRLARRKSDEALAQLVETEGVGPFLERWLSQPLFTGLPAERAQMSERLTNTATGLASSLRLSGTGSQDPLWGRLAELGARALPVLLVAGERDVKYVDLAYRLATGIGPCARVAVVAGAGHACHLERPEEVASIVDDFCEAT